MEDIIQWSGGITDMVSWSQMGTVFVQICWDDSLIFSQLLSKILALPVMNGPEWARTTPKHHLSEPYGEYSNLPNTYKHSDRMENKNNYITDDYKYLPRYIIYLPNMQAQEKKTNGLQQIKISIYGRL
jgi:hypothetical protein